MADYKITIARSAGKELERLNESLRSRVFNRIAPWIESQTGRMGKLEGAEDLWRIRVSDYRVIYSVDDSRELVDIISMRH